MLTPEYLTSFEVADILRCGPDSVYRIFADRPGVIDLGSPETFSKRRYRVLRIPRTALESYIIEAGNSRKQPTTSRSRAASRKEKSA